MQSSNKRSDEQVKKQTLGKMIALLRKENGMTQLELAEKMGVTDKAVSKWERDLSFPDVSSIPKLAEIFGISVDELMQVKANAQHDDKINETAEIIFKGVALAMGVAVAVLSFMDQMDVKSAVGMLGVGLAYLALYHFFKKSDS